MDAILNEGLKAFIKNPETGVFAVLFIVLLVWVMKQNNYRELRYLDTIDELTKKLRDVESIKNTVDKIHDKLK